MRFTMSNPGKRARSLAENPAALLFGNPPRKDRSMAKKSRKSKGKRRTAAQRAATKRMLAANRAKRGVKRAARKASKGRKRASTGKRRSRRARRSAAPAIVKRVYVTRQKGKARRRIKLEVRAVKRSKSRRRRKARGSLIRTLRINPALSLSAFTAPILGVVGNLKSSLSSAAGIAGIAGGAIGAVAGGTLIARGVMPLAMRFAPGFAASPMGARALSVLCYYGAGYLLARFLPVNEKIKRGILAGAVSAAVLEVVRPGTVQGMVSKVPGVGPLIAGNLGGIEPELGAYVDQVLAGLGGSVSDQGGAAFAADALGAYVGMGEYDLGALSTEELTSVGTY